MHLYSQILWNRAFTVKIIDSFRTNSKVTALFGILGAHKNLHVYSNLRYLYKSRLFSVFLDKKTILTSCNVGTHIILGTQLYSCRKLFCRSLLYRHARRGFDVANYDLKKLKRSWTQKTDGAASVQAALIPAQKPVSRQATLHNPRVKLCNSRKLKIFKTSSSS